MISRICDTCLAWELAADDAYCGCCGSPCAQLHLQIIPEILHIGQVAPPVGLKVINSSCTAVAMSAIECPAWISVGNPDQEPPIPPRESRLIFARAQTLELEQPQADWVHVVTQAGSVRAQILAIAERPVVAALPDPIPIWVDRRRRGRQRVPVKLRIPEGGLRIVEVLVKVPWLSAIGPAEPVMSTAGEPLAMEIEVDAAAVSAMQTNAGALTVRYESPHGLEVIEVLLRFQIYSAPELRWAGASQPPPIRSRMDRQKLGFVFRNRAEDDPQGGRMNAAVVLKNVEIGAEEGSPDPGARRISPLPRKLAGGTEYEVAFELNLEEHEPGLHMLRLAIVTDCAEIDCQFNGGPGSLVTIDVCKVREFEGSIAIDFGTSNTCCAVLPNGGDVESIPIDVSPTPTTAPTVVRYRDLSGRFPEIETGATVKKQAALSSEYATSMVDRLKQQLGEAVHPLRVRPVATGRWVFRDARLVARDYLHHVRLSAELVKGVVFRRFILTHPAVCSIRQYRNLRWALHAAFGDTHDVQFLQEPVAALIPFFQARANNSSDKGYTVAAFDLGGGTTDITIVRVERRRTGAGEQIRPKIVASWGERFGGENLTDFLAAEVLSRAREVLANRQPDLLVAARNVPGASDSAIRGNEAALRDWAETFKAAGSEEYDYAQTGVKTLILRTISKYPDRPPAPFPFQPEQIGAGDDGELQRIFEMHCRAQIQAIADRMVRTLQGREQLTHIQLSGKTTFLPVVRETLKSAFRGVAIERAADPKQCVVRGACLYHAMTNSRLHQLVMADTQRTTSSIGLMDADAGRFRAAILFDTPLSPGGVLGELPGAWNGCDGLVIWENLGVEDVRLFRDGSVNPDLTRLGSWVPERSVETADGPWWTARFTLDASFRLSLEAISPGGETVRFRSPESEGVET